MIRERHSSNISSNVYYASIGSEVLRFAKNTFVTLSNSLLWRMQKQQRKHRSRISMLNKIFDKYLTVFKVFADTAANFIKLF